MDFGHQIELLAVNAALFDGKAKFAFGIVDLAQCQYVRLRKAPGDLVP